jgi:predicted ArsR family transcriptional regulator
MSPTSQSEPNADAAMVGVAVRFSGGRDGCSPSSFRSSDPLRSVDSQLLDALASRRRLGVGDLIKHLGVTATAVRQRVERLLEAGLIERHKVVSGRGRPSFEYQLTERGQWCAGADPTDLAQAMWQEILRLEDHHLRSKLLAGVASRIGRSYANRVAVSRPNGSDSSAGDGLVARMDQLGELLATRRITNRVGNEGDFSVRLPVLDFQACPYPALRDSTEDRSMCKLETQMLSEALGQPLRLSSCVLDGDAVCRFVPEPAG